MGVFNQKYKVLLKSIFMEKTAAAFFQDPISTEFTL